MSAAGDSIAVESTTVVSATAESAGAVSVVEVEQAESNVIVARIRIVFFIFCCVFGFLFICFYTKKLVKVSLFTGSNFKSGVICVCWFAVWEIVAFYWSTTNVN